MPRELEPEELKKYCYWRQFLLRSERYEKLCAFINRKKKEYPFDELVASWCPASGYDDLVRPYLDWVTDHVSVKELQTKFDDEFTYGDILESYYPLFQDVFNEPFSKVEHRIRLFYELNDAKAIGSARGDMVNLLSFSFKSNKVHDSHVRHTKDIYLDFEDYIDGRLATQVVNPDYIVRIYTSYPEKYIISQFKEYLKAILKDAPSPCFWLQPYFTQGRRDFPAWEDCLEAFDLFEGMADMKPQDIVEIARIPGLNKTNFTNRLESAQMYIKRAEKGTFPAPLPTEEDEEKANANSSNHHSPEYEKIAHLIEARWQKKQEKEPAKRFPLSHYFPDNGEK